MNTTALLETKAMVDSFLNQGPRPLAVFSFISIFAWADFFTFEFKIIQHCLCVFAHGQAGSFLYLPPLGKALDASILEEVFAHMAPKTTVRGVCRVENIPENLLFLFNHQRYNRYARSEEYLYTKQALIDLAGKAYKSQRHDCHLFNARQKVFVFEAYTDFDFEDCQELYRTWAWDRTTTHSDSVYQAMLDENRVVHARLLTFAKPLGLVARVLKVQGRLVGYTFGFALDASTFCVYAEIADLRYKGSSAFLFRCLCQDQALKSFTFINTMDDFAMPNVARTKQAYHPCALIPSYSAVIKEKHEHSIC